MSTPTRMYPGCNRWSVCLCESVHAACAAHRRCALWSLVEKRTASKFTSPFRWIALVWTHATWGLCTCYTCHLIVRVPPENTWEWGVQTQDSTVQYVSSLFHTILRTESFRSVSFMICSLCVSTSSAFVSYDSNGLHTGTIVSFHTLSQNDCRYCVMQPLPT